MSFSLNAQLIASRGMLLAASLLAAGMSRAGLAYDEAQRLALEQQGTALVAQRLALEGAEVARAGAATLPDPRLITGVDNFPVGGPDRYRLTRDFMTMQRIGLMQEVPNRAKREARAAGARAKVERERAQMVVAELALRREVGLAWLAVHFSERRAGQLAELERENRLLQETLDARIAAGRAMPAERTMARQEALALADRRDDAQRDIAKARAALRRFVGQRADEPLSGSPPVLAPDIAKLRETLHRHAEIAPYEAMQAMARAEAGEADAERHGDWAWELSYSRRGAQFGDMVSFQLSFDLPWQRRERQQPQLAARLAEVRRIEAERDDMLRRHAEELQGQFAELQALDAQHARLADAGLALAAERVALTLASYQAGRADLAAVLGARREAVEARLRLIDLEAQRTVLRLRLATLIAKE